MFAAAVLFPSHFLFHSDKKPECSVTKYRALSFVLSFFLLYAVPWMFLNERGALVIQYTV